MNNHRIITQLVKHTLLNYDKFDDWSLQGFGMLRLYMPDRGLRMAIWDKRFRVHNVSMLHTHPWHFESYVVCGLMMNHKYRDVSDQYKADQPTHWKQRIQAGEGGGIVGEPDVVRLHHFENVIIRPGGSYGQHHDEIHVSEPDDGTVTLCDRVVVDPADPHHADVYWEIGNNWVSAEPFTPSMGVVKLITEKALEKLK